MRGRRVLLGLLLSISVAGGPDVAVPLPVADARARDAAIALIESKRTDDHRQCYSIHVPERPMDVPQSYGARA
ncbi:MAG: hypothetical protein JXP34_21675 [Planctomycetes bacterium]|nr:hypothetical protein [Planctomycetota bacterium]